MIGPRKVDKGLILYGKGKLGRLAKAIFDRLEIKVIAWIDKNSHSVIYPGIRHEFLVANAVSLYSPKEIETPLREQGYTDIVPVWDIIEAYPAVGLHNGWFGTWDELTVAHTTLVLSLLSDNSKNAYHRFIQYRLHRTPYEQVSEREGSDYVCLNSDLESIISRREYDPFKLHDMPYTMDRTRVEIHAEGNEMGLLFCYINRIREERPILKVACYHSEDGLWRIPYFLMSRLENYRFEFKLYAYQGQAAFLYCYPEK